MIENNQLNLIIIITYKMYSLISGFLNWYFDKPTYKLLIIGDEQSGKSVLLINLL
jgi:GTPase SAR1 family protein